MLTNRENHLKSTFFLLFFCLITSCSVYQKSDKADIAQPSEEGGSIDFLYTLNSPSASSSSTLTVDCILINNSGKQVRYLQESCNELESFILFKPNDFKVTPSKQCFTSFPQVKQLNSGDTVKFTMQVAPSKGAKVVNALGLDFRIVSGTETLEALNKNTVQVDSLYRLKAKESDIIWGKRLEK